jgi:hypothetical protein
VTRIDDDPRLQVTLTSGRMCRENDRMLAGQLDQLANSTTWDQPEVGCQQHRRPCRIACANPTRCRYPFDSFPILRCTSPKPQR